MLRYIGLGRPSPTQGPPPPPLGPHGSRNAGQIRPPPDFAAKPGLSPPILRGRSSRQRVTGSSPSSSNPNTRPSSASSASSGSSSLASSDQRWLQEGTTVALNSTVPTGNYAGLHQSAAAMHQRGVRQVYAEHADGLPDHEAKVKDINLKMSRDARQKAYYREAGESLADALVKSSQGAGGIEYSALAGPEAVAVLSNVLEARKLEPVKGSSLRSSSADSHSSRVSNGEGVLKNATRYGAHVLTKAFYKRIATKFAGAPVGIEANRHWQETREMGRTAKGVGKQTARLAAQAAQHHKSDTAPAFLKQAPGNTRIVPPPPPNSTAPLPPPPPPATHQNRGGVHLSGAGRGRGQMPELASGFGNR